MRPVMLVVWMAFAGCATAPVLEARQPEARMQEVSSSWVMPDIEPTEIAEWPVGSLSGETAGVWPKEPPAPPRAERDPVMKLVTWLMNDCADGDGDWVSRIGPVSVKLSVEIGRYGIVRHIDVVTKPRLRRLEECVRRRAKRADRVDMLPGLYAIPVQLRSHGGE
jgi:hypothetical protein